LTGSKRACIIKLKKQKMATIRSQLSVAALVIVITTLFGLFVWAALTGRINFLAAQGPRLYLDPVNKTAQAGETVPLTIRIDSGGKNVVAATADITYSNSDLSLLNISPSGDNTSGTVFRYSIEERQNEGSVRITRGTPGNGNADDSVGGYTGKDGVFATLNFKALRGASVTINKTTSALIADDGNGTNILNATDGATVKITATQPPGPPGTTTGCTTPSNNSSAYDYAWVRQNAFPTLDWDQAYQFSVTVKNTGTATWCKGTVNLGTDRAMDRIPGFIREGGDPSGWILPNRVELSGSSVAPGAETTFTFWMKVPHGFKPGTYKEYFRPVSDGVSWMRDLGIYWDVTVPDLPGLFRSEWVSQNGFPTLKRGEKYQFEVKIKNTGVRTWERDKVNLGTDRPRDRVPGFIREGDGPSGWLKENRVEMVEAQVVPGETATFRFWYTVSSDKPLGTYKEYFRPVAEFITWIEPDQGIYWDVTVGP
jgi:hypothetical protein